MEHMKKGEILSRAITIATEAHRGQFDRGGNPYILHPIAVMQLMETKDEELQSMAILHDVVEDCNVTWKDLEDGGMTPRIIAALKCVTKMPGQSYDEYRALVKSNPDAVKVKMADLRHNSDITRLKGVREKDLERMATYQRFYYELSEHQKTIYTDKKTV